LRGGAAGHVHWLLCSLVAVVEEPLSIPEGRVMVWNEPVRGTSDVEGTEGREERNS
jgi:hypothetical protein